MTKRERSSRPDRPSTERSLDALLDRGSLDRGSLDGGAMPDGDPARWQPVAQVLAALNSAPESSELTGQARALAEFRASAAAPARGPAPAPAPAPRRELGWMTWLPGRRPAVAAASGAVLMGGFLAVAYAGDLPVPAQRLAHSTIHAPAASPDPDPAASSRPSVPPNPAGRAAQVPAVPDHRVHSGFAAGPPRRPGSSASPSSSSSGRPGSGRPGSGQLSLRHPGSGRQGQSGPGGSPGPVLTPWPSPSASSPPAGATPSPSAAPSPSQSGAPNPQSGPSSPSSPQSTPP
jgi:hypothetical protein